jgi:Branched-chain amino acid transport protein (AzlD)
MTAVWITIAALALGTFAAKLVGPLTVGDRVPEGRGLDVTRLVAPAILAGLVVYETFTADDGFALDARVAGLAAAAAALWARLPAIVVVVLAAAATALTRALV